MVLGLLEDFCSVGAFIGYTLGTAELHWVRSVAIVGNLLHQAPWKDNSRLCRYLLDSIPAMPPQSHLTEAFLHAGDFLPSALDALSTCSVGVVPRLFEAWQTHPRTLFTFIQHEANKPAALMLRVLS